MDQQYELDSSSIILLFLNPPTGLKSKLNFNITGHSDSVSKLKSAVKKFHYLGFCAKEPNKRLKELLSFPINEFIKVIRKLDKGAKFPEYAAIEKIIADMLTKMPEVPKIVDNIPREKVPLNLKDNLEIAKWYIDAILDLRKKLLQYGNMYEEYYTKQAKIFVEINDQVQKKLLHKH